ncbi:MAG: hypothetical protein COA92_06275 [Sulfurovum sp.]|nr:MAG: hypothetical protein COA92_06275 [Sulfurovum sp.]
MISLVLVLVSCTNKEYEKQESVFIVFKTPTLKYADLGFIYQNNDEMKIEIYGSGQALMTLEISKKNVCMSFLECMHNDDFNTQVLSSWYPDELLGNIFRGQPIFQGKGLSKNSHGFTQKIDDKHKYNIRYNIFNKEVVFRDTINDIVIKIKRVGS